jgi:hypothetical protein
MAAPRSDVVKIQSPLNMLTAGYTLGLCGNGGAPEGYVTFVSSAIERVRIDPLGPLRRSLDERL